jgi:hypothetical protein
VFPGLNKSWYGGEYWPSRIDHCNDDRIFQFIERSLYLIPLGPRRHDYHVLNNTCITPEGARALSDATEDCWKAILNQDSVNFGHAVRRSFEAQITMFPNMMNDMIEYLIKQYQDVALGWKVSGAGGGGYLILVSQTPIHDALRIIIRRASD